MEGDPTSEYLGPVDPVTISPATEAAMRLGCEALDGIAANPYISFDLASTANPAFEAPAAYILAEL